MIGKITTSGFVLGPLRLLLSGMFWSAKLHSQVVINELMAS